MEHAAKTQERLELLRNDEQHMYQLAKQLLQPGHPIFQLDFLAYAALKRHMSTLSAIIRLIEDFNMLAARSLLRVHIDTAIRFAAAWFVDEPHDFASAVHGGARIDKMKDRYGQRLTDARLIELLSPDHPWLATVYESLSGYIHFSGRHIAATITGLNHETGRVTFQFGKRDEH